jgi:hypothetical protein
MSISETPEKTSGKTLATITLALALLVAFAAGLFVATLAGCSPPRVPESQLVPFALVLDSGGDALAVWSLSRAHCEGLSPVDCVEVARESDRALWDAWDAVAAAWDAYRAGGEPGPVLDAYCALVRALPADAPRVLVVPGLCG